MSKPHFKELGLGSFFGEFVYSRVVPRDHFLVKLNQVMDWESFVPLLLPTYKGLAETGQTPYSPIVLLKMLLLAYLYHISERQVEDLVNFQLPAKEFVGLAIDATAPDHSTLGLFKRRLREAGAANPLEAIADAVLRQAQAQGIQFGSLQIVDSVHSVANVDNDADRQRQAEGKPPRDPEATLVHKGTRPVTQPDGQVKAQEIRYKGYKSHVSLNAETGLITTVYPTSGRAADNEQFPHLLAHDQRLHLPTAAYTGDMAYDDTDQHVRLWDLKLFSAFRQHAYRTQKKDGNKEIWFEIQADSRYAESLHERYKIERKFGEGGLWHGWGACRYLGLARFALQTRLTALVLNLKRIVLLVTGVPFRTPSKRADLLGFPVR